MRLVGQAEVTKPTHALGRIDKVVFIALGCFTWAEVDIDRAVFVLLEVLGKGIDRRDIAFFRR